MSQHEATVMISQSADRIFDAMLDLRLWHQWHTGDVKVEQISPGALQEGTMIREEFWLVPPFKGNAICRITAYEPGRRFEYETVKSPVQAKIYHRLEPVDGGTRVTLGSITPSVGLFKWFERIFPNMGQRVIEEEALNLKRLVESENPATTMSLNASR